MARLSDSFYLTSTLVSLFVMGASSQAPLPPCAEACLEEAASSSGCSPTDANCVCNSQAFPDAMATCLRLCLLAEAEAAVAFLDEFCSGATSPSSGSFSVEPSMTESTQAPSSILSTPSSTSTPGSSPLFTSSEPATPTQQSTTQQQSTTGPTTSITSRPSTGSTVSSASVTSSTASTPPGPTPSNHADRGRTARLLTSIVFALAVGLVVW